MSTRNPRKYKETPDFSEVSFSICLIIYLPSAFPVLRSSFLPYIHLQIRSVWMLNLHCSHLKAVLPIHLLPRILNLSSAPFASGTAVLFVERLAILFSSFCILLLFVCNPVLSYTHSIWRFYNITLVFFSFFSRSCIQSW